MSAAAQALHVGRESQARIDEVRDSLSELQALRDRAAALASQLTAAQAPSVVA